MRQTIVQEVLDYYTDKTTSMAVKIAKQAEELENLKKEMAYHDDLRQQVRDELEQVRFERDCLVRDLRVRQVEAKQGRERLEHLHEAEAILKKAAEYTDAVIIFELADLSRAYFEKHADPVPAQ